MAPSPYSISGPVLSGSVTITAGLLSQVQGTVVVVGTHGNPVTIGINQICLLGACLGTISVTDPASGIAETVPSSISLGSIGADKATAQGRAVRPATGNGYAPAAFEKDPDAAGIKSKAFAAAMDRLFKAEKIVTKANHRGSKFIERTTS